MTVSGLRVALVTPRYPPLPGDLARSAFRLAHGLTEAGADVVVFTDVRVGAVFVESAETKGPRVYRPSKLLEGLAALDLEEASRPFDLFHGVTLPAAFTCLQMIPRDECPFVVTLQEEDTGGIAVQHASQTLQRASWITSFSDDVLRRLGRLGDISGRCSAIPPGIDAARLPEWRVTPENHGVVGTTIDVRQTATVRWVMEAFRRLPPSVRRQLVISEEVCETDAAEPAETLEWRRACDRSPDVEITSAPPDGMVPDWYRRLGVFVMPANHDGALHTLLCAAAAGVPIVAAAVDGVKQLLAHRVNALLVEPGNAEQLADAIREVLTNDDLAATLSNAARSTVPRITPATEYARYADVYRRLFERRPARAHPTAALRRDEAHRASRRRDPVKRIGVVTFGQQLGKPHIGSTRIRASWPLKYWPEAEEFKIARHYDVLVFQKAYWVDYAIRFGGLKILDLCDPDFLDDLSRGRCLAMMEVCDAITCATPALAEYVSGVTRTPVRLIPDRLDFAAIGPARKDHHGPTTTAAWYGYSGNFPMLDTMIDALVTLGVGKLLVIADENDPYELPPRAARRIVLENRSWSEKTVYGDLLAADVVLNPRSDSGRWRFKSDNKTILAWALGLPVARDGEELARLMSEDDRRREADRRHGEVRANCDVRRTVDEYRRLIGELRANATRPVLDARGTE